MILMDPDFIHMDSPRGICGIDFIFTGYKQLSDQEWFYQTGYIESFRTLDNTSILYSMLIME